MLIKSPPHWRYIRLSARVENCGPSMHTIHLSVTSLTPRPSSSKTRPTGPASHWTSLRAKGSPNAACATTLASKKLAGRMPRVRSIICVGSANVPGGISSRSEPTALNASTARTPRDLSAAMFARVGIAVGLIVCPAPCRARKATRVPDGNEAIVIGEEGYPHGCKYYLCQSGNERDREVSSIPAVRGTVPSLGLRAC
jgi:hypothetical protein